MGGWKPFILTSALLIMQAGAVHQTLAVEEGAEGIGMRILYAGQPESRRGDDFVRFLEEHFAAVGEADLRTFGEAQAKGFDVVILDWDGMDLRAPRPPLSDDYARATVTVGVPGARICGGQRLKTGYL